MNKFSTATYKGHFLFGPEMNSYLDKVRDKCFSLRRIGQQLENQRLGIGEKRSRLAKEREEVFLWFCAQRDESKQLFRKYLKMEN